MMQKEFAAEMEQVNNIVKSKTAVPTSLVYVSFWISEIISFYLPVDRFA